MEVSNRLKNLSKILEKVIGYLEYRTGYFVSVSGWERCLLWVGGVTGQGREAALYIFMGRKNLSMGKHCHCLL